VRHVRRWTGAHASAIADAIAYPISQSAEVDVNSIIVRPSIGAQ
jgi:NADP-dependent 3-hydroxy acid dehydrogenase YdfG